MLSLKEYLSYSRLDLLCFNFQIKQTNKLFYFILEKVYEEEEKQKLSQEKFNKLKNMYTQIRDEHINLLRQVRKSHSLIVIISL